MSIESMAIALHHSRAEGTALLVLIGIANHDGDGGSWPSVATLARYARVTERNARKAILRLVELGEVAVEYGAGGTRETPEFRRPNRYHVRVICPSDCDRTKHHRTRRTAATTPLPLPLSPATPPVASDTPPPVASDTPPPVASDTRTIHVTHPENTGVEEVPQPQNPAAPRAESIAEIHAAIAAARDRIKAKNAEKRKSA